ncbi:hypothetical protein CPB84DRAFT_1753128 [Gymnopilus junonius]|uniref:Uncharacterized protein n=1 Tax=Gymnopilus junonius TaxID=109634 RepID=A0A9P5TFD8_GYMJU|nr:hypothetical protein CPB84DRAFT_1753128 [Gymnopilus junonius]
MWKSSDSSTSGSDTEMEVDPQNLHNPEADDSEVSSLSSLSSLDSLDSLSDLDEDDDPLAPPMDLDDVEGTSADEDSEEEAQLSFVGACSEKSQMVWIEKRVEKPCKSRGGAAFAYLKSGSRFSSSVFTDVKSDIKIKLENRPKSGSKAPT